MNPRNSVKKRSGYLTQLVINPLSTLIIIIFMTLNVVLKDFNKGHSLSTSSASSASAAYRVVLFLPVEAYVHGNTSLKRINRDNDFDLGSLQFQKKT